MKVIDYTIKNGKVTNADVREILNVSKPTATRILASLSNYLKLAGTSGRGAYYTIIGS